MSGFTSLIPYLVAYGGPSAPSVLAAAGFCRSALATALVSLQDLGCYAKKVASHILMVNFLSNVKRATETILDVRRQPDQPLFTRQMCEGMTVQGASSLLGGLALLLTPLPLLLYIHGGKLRDHVRHKKDAAAAAEAAAKAAKSGLATPEETEQKLDAGERTAPGGSVEREVSRSSVDISTVTLDDIA